MANEPLQMLSRCVPTVAGSSSRFTWIQIPFMPWSQRFEVAERNMLIDIAAEPTRKQDLP